jgi:hypothetical protein
MDRVLAVCAAVEAVTGVALAAYPHIVVGLLLGAAPAGAGIAVTRIAGIALLALGIACWPGGNPNRTVDQAYGGMLTYSAFVSLCLAYAGLADKLIGPLLFPAVAGHAMLAVLLTLAWSRRRLRFPPRLPSTTAPHPATLDS